MEEFLLFFLSIFVFFILINKLFKNGEVITIKSKLDGRNYIVRKLPDAIKAADKLATINSNVQKLISTLNTGKKGVSKLKSRYNPNTLSETGIGAKYTSYSVNKGEKISICVRQIDDSFIDDNTIMFVVIHELAHVMSESIGHTKEFWDNMKYLLEEGEKIGIYRPVNYKENPETYCGMEINSTPYHF